MTARIETTQLIQAEAVERAPGQNYLERYRAPFSLRCGAFLIDYILLAAIIAFSTVLARVGVRPRALTSTSETLGFLVAGAAALLNFVGLTALRGQTIGKWATGLRIRRRDGEPLSLGYAALRHLVAYPLSFLILAVGLLVAEMHTAAKVAGAGFILTIVVGFLMAAFSANGRALHDIIADTVVIREDLRRTRRIR